jgi:hypothetical protein
VAALRTLGGISMVLDGVIRETVSGWESNPRLRHRMKELTNDLQRQLPALRRRVQHFLNLIDLGRLHAGRRSVGAVGGEAAAASAPPLAPGLHAEVLLVNDKLGWYGKADLLRVSAITGAANEDEIVDFKTGLPKAEHSLQLRIYAVLWARDKRLNPAGRQAHRLTVLYDFGSVDIPAPITDADLNSIEHELAERTANARAAIQQHPPAAVPSREACEWCDVRQLCTAYWAPATRAAITPSEEPSRHTVDVGVQILQGQGAWSWIALVREVGALSENVAIGERLLLRARPHDEHFGAFMNVNEHLRIVGAQYGAASEESGGLALLSLTRSTEVFLRS